MKTAWLVGEKKIVVRDEPFNPTLKDDEVLVDVKATTICASDSKHYIRGLIRDNGPVILGHEPAGVILEVGRGVTDLRPGDRVSIEPLLYCGKCLQCRRGRTNMCENSNFMARNGFPGAMVEQLVWPAVKCHPIPDEMPFEVGAMIEPTSIATNVIQRIPFDKTDRIAILGAGGIGMLGRIVIHMIKPEVEVYMLDIEDAKLDLCRNVGVPNTYYVNTRGDYEIPSVDAIIELTGFPSALQKAFKFLTPGGCIGCIGFTRKYEPLGLTIEDILFKQATIFGSGLFVNTWPFILGLIEKNPHALEYFKKVVSKTFPIEQTDEAFAETVNKRDQLKVAVIMNRDH